tara:strand:+ start:489 stop:644 length:156 start_codon:yes stop_codon:yes gene_type:complete
MYKEPGALRCYSKGSDVPMESFLSYLSNEEARYLLEMSVSDLVLLPAAKAA